MKKENTREWKYILLTYSISSKLLLSSESLRKEDFALFISN